MNNPVELPQAVTGRQTMTASEAFVETLVANRVTDVFGIVGSAYMDALDLFPLAGIRFISVAHEQGGGHAGRRLRPRVRPPRVCIAQNGPGITNFVTATAAAYWAHSPVVVVTPETGSGTIGLGGFQETEQLPIFSKITKFQAHVSKHPRMAELTARCFDMAMSDGAESQYSRDNFYGEADYESPSPQIARGPGADESLDEAADFGHQFPVLLLAVAVLGWHEARGFGRTAQCARGEFLSAQ
jgi:sulfoacetaldehyde acetyltransferase